MVTSEENARQVKHMQHVITLTVLRKAAQVSGAGMTVEGDSATVTATLDEWREFLAQTRK